VRCRPNGFELIHSYGLPAWVTLIIGAGTVTAALIIAECGHPRLDQCLAGPLCVAIYTAHSNFGTNPHSPIKTPLVVSLALQ
jgi:hypothetical protein